MTLEPLAEAALQNLEHLELRVQNENGFGPEQLQPLATAKLPKLRCFSYASITTLMILYMAISNFRTSLSPVIGC